MQSHSAEDRYDEGPGWSWRIGPTGRQRPTPLATSTPKALDRITRLAGENLDIPAVCATLVGGGGELVASCYGLDVPMALLVTHTLRRHLSGAPALFVVVDATRDPRVAGSPVVRDGTVRALVGVGLRDRDHLCVGSLLLLDRTPRRWTPSQLDLIRAISDVIEDEIENEPASAVFARPPKERATTFVTANPVGSVPTSSSLDDFERDTDDRVPGSAHLEIEG